MRRRIIVVFFSLLLFGAGPAAAAERGALFKVSDKGHTMYLFGTMHVGLPEFYPLEKRITDAVAGASTLALEIEPARAALAMPALVERYAMREPGTDPYAGAPAGLEPRLASALRKAGLQSELAKTLKPWLLATLLSVQQAVMLGYRAELGTDFQLAKLARDGKVKVIGLETLSGQLAFFHRLPEAQQWQYLAETVDAIESGKAATETARLVAAWRGADRATFDSIAAELEKDTSWGGNFMREVMLVKRNGPMADKLAALLADEKNTVAAVGVLHLVGKSSLPELLRARGLAVEQLY